MLRFTQDEIVYILLGEGITDIGRHSVWLPGGAGLAGILVRAFDSERFRQSRLLTLLNYTVNAVVIIVSALLSGLLLWRRLGRLDLVGMLKTRE